MAAARKEEAAPAQAATADLVSYKGFDADWTCRGFQYEVGKTYEHDGPVVACESGFHGCEYPLHILRYYRPASSVYAVVRQGGTIDRHAEDSKIASSRLSVTVQIDIAGLVKAAIKYTLDRCTPAEGAHTDEANRSVSANGTRKSATASGYSGAATASGYSGAATASGFNGRARGAIGCALFLVHRDADRKITHAKALIVGRDGIKPDTYYRLDDGGNAVEVAS